MRKVGPSLHLKAAAVFSLELNFQRNVRRELDDFSTDERRLEKSSYRTTTEHSGTQHREQRLSTVHTASTVWQ